MREPHCRIKTIIIGAVHARPGRTWCRYFMTPQGVKADTYVISSVLYDENMKPIKVKYVLESQNGN